MSFKIYTYKRNANKNKQTNQAKSLRILCAIVILRARVSARFFFFGILFQFANGRKEVPSETSQKNVNDMKEGLLASKLQLHHSSVWNCKRSFSSI